MNKFVLLTVFVLGLVLTSVFIMWQYFGPPGKSSDKEVFTIPGKPENFDITQNLYDQGFIKNKAGFGFLKKIPEVKSGGYYLSKNLFAWQVITKITGQPDLLWLTISGCPRKEQVGEKLAQLLGWGAKELGDWNSLYKDLKNEYYEGVYYPDTYLIPVIESPGQVAKRFIDRFNSRFSPLADKFTQANIKWTTGLKIASLIAREAGGAEDMYLVSGIIWNRLNEGMRLQIDATMQYTLGKRADGSWWGPVDIKEKQEDSPYNTYLYKGLPPTPICSPNIDYLKAALNPQATDCLYYLHDPTGQIHCSTTYSQHLKAIRLYL